MIIVKIMGGFASQVNKFMLGHSIAGYLETELILDVSDYFDGYFRPYSLCYFKLPNCRLITRKDEIPRHVKYVRNSGDMELMLADGNRRDYYLDREEDDYRAALDKHPGLEIHAEMDALAYMRFKQPTPFWDTFKRQAGVEKSVGIHIRRGDFVKLGWQDDTRYFRAAIAWFLEKDRDMHFYFFSNDIQWVMEQFGSDGRYHYVRSVDGNFGDVEELFCMASCTCRILSRFSGYGRLANILSSFWNRKNGLQAGYAVMNACRVESGLEGQQDLEEPADRFGDEIRKCEIVKKEDGGILYFDEGLVENYHKKYTLYVCPEGQNGDGTAGHIGTDGDMEQALRLQYQKYQDSGNRVMQRECLERMEITEQTKAMWEEWYGVNSLRHKKVFLFTCEKRNRWKIRGMFLLALLLARCGAEVYYVPWTEKKAERGAPADMDGKKLPFQILALADLSQMCYENSEPAEVNNISIRDSLWREDSGVSSGTDIYISNLTGRKEKKAAFAKLLSDRGLKDVIRSFSFRGVRTELKHVNSSECYSDDISSPYDLQEACEKKYMELMELLI